MTCRTIVSKPYPLPAQARVTRSPATPLNCTGLAGITRRVTNCSCPQTGHWYQVCSQVPVVSWRVCPMEDLQRVQFMVVAPGSG